MIDFDYDDSPGRNNFVILPGEIQTQILALNRMSCAVGDRIYRGKIETFAHLNDNDLAELVSGKRDEIYRLAKLNNIASETVDAAIAWVRADAQHPASTAYRHLRQYSGQFRYE